MLLKRYVVLAERCTACQRCLAVCPVGAIELSEAGIPEIQIPKCRRCGACKKICSQQAIINCVKLRF